MANPFTSKTAAPVTTGYGSEIAELQRQQQYADLLRQQSLEPMGDTQVVSGWAIKKSPTEGLAKMLQAYGARKNQDEVLEKQKALEQKMISDRQSSLADYMRLSQGTPGQVVDDESGGHMTPAQAPNRQAALASLLQAKDPALQQMGLAEMQKEMQRHRFAQMLTGGSGTQGQPPGFTAHGVPMDMAQMLTSSDDPMEAYIKLAEKLREPKMSNDGKVLSYQNLGGNWGYAPAPGSVSAVQAFQNVANQNEFVDIPDGSGGTIKMWKDQALGAVQPPQKGAIGDFQGPPDEVMKQIMSIPDPKERVAAFTAYTNNNQPGAAQRLGYTPSEAQRAAEKKKAEVRAEREVNAPEAQKSAELSVGNIDRALGSLAALANDPGLSNITGSINGRLPSISDRGVNAEAKLNTLATQISGQVIQAMRDASRTGGAVGNVTEKEWPRLEGMLGRLSRVQTTSEFKKGLQDIEMALFDIRRSIAEAHLKDYPGARLPNAPGTAFPQQSGGRIKVISVTPVGE